MSREYFYGNQAEQFSFFRIPKALFTDMQFAHISAEAKILYGMLLDRMSLSQKNGWLDADNRVYIIFTIDEVMSCMGCAVQKATKLFGELDGKCGLIERKRQGLGKPNIIYVKNFITSEKSQIQNYENQNSGFMKSESPELPKSKGSNTKSNKTEFSNTDSLPFTSFKEPQEKNRKEAMLREILLYREIIKENIDYDILLSDLPYDRDRIDEIVELLVETICSGRKLIRVAGNDYPAEVVRSRLLKLDSEHIRFVFDCMKDNTTKVRNIKQYLLTALYNAPGTIENYYSALVNHDMYGDKKQGG